MADNAKATEIRVITEAEIKDMITPRPADIHKGRCGRVLLICGSRGMAGAAVLCARAALRSGAGLVTVALPEELFPILQTAVPEAMCMERAAALTDPDRFDAIAIGPGLGEGEEQYRMIEHLLLGYHGPLVIDADGINSLCRYGMAPTRESYMDTAPLDELKVPRKQTSILPDIGKKRKEPVVLTPHPGEADRLLAMLGKENTRSFGREASARILAEETGAIIVLKGQDTLIAAANANAAGAAPSMTEADIVENPTGNPGMATGGSGDVLTGVTAALLAWGKAGRRTEDLGLTPESCVRAAVYIHGLAGDLAAREKGEIGMTSMDIAEALPAAFREIAGR
ncbi:MAG: NAD(P)H-hydrate dehydratase [Firmicutes bacterium]|nr:NAD(P)H-hydrate dehydratase [Bacillota bacterium]